MTLLMTGPQGGEVGRHFGTRELWELEETLGIPVVEWPLPGHPGMETEPEGHWCRMVARSHTSWSFQNDESLRKKQVSKIAVKGQDTDTMSIGISLRWR